MIIMTRNHPETVNGLPIQQASPFIKREGCMPTRAILVARGDDEWVTALQCADPLTGKPAGEWMWGHYFGDSGEALADYIERAAKLACEGGQ